MIETQLAEDASLIHDEGYLESRNDALMTALEAEIPWSQRQVTVWNRTYDEPRLASWHGDPGCAYRYSGLVLAPQPWTPTLTTLRDALIRDLGVPFNTCLANLYRTGQDRMGWHADDEACFGHNPTIASLSFGHRRRFRLKHREDKADQHVFELGAGSLLVMRGGTQRLYRHGITKTAREVGPRINLTFRHYRQ